MLEWYDHPEALKYVSSQEPDLSVNDRLLMIPNDREVMKQRVRDKARRMGKSEDEIAVSPDNVETKL